MKKKLQVIAVMLLLSVVIANAQYTKLHDMQNGEPNGSLTIVGNTMYGTGYEGGKNGFGYIFSVNRDGTGFKDIFDFADTGSVAGKCNGTNPWGNITYLNGKLYGFTEYGGLHNQGTIFWMNTNGSGYKDLWDFTTASGKWPVQGGLTPYGKKLYGMASGGGAATFGNIFSIDTTGKNYADIYDFLDTGHVAGYYDGARPYNSTFVISNNRMYGMTNNGGAYGYGTVFSIDTNGSGYKDVMDFDNINSGASPTGSLLLLGNKLFGMTFQGNSNYNSGSIFSVDTNGQGYKTLLYFNDTNGGFPNGGLSLSSRGKLYGMTHSGGHFKTGVVFSVDTNGSNYTTLFSFDTLHGSYPAGNLTIEQDTLFGMAQYGGVKDSGVIFRYIDTSITESVNTISAGVSNVSVYPNPSNGVFTFQIRNLQSGIRNQVEIYNMLGEKVYAAQLSTVHSQFVIDLSNNASGIYLYRIISNSGELVKEGKLVIEK